MKNQSNQLYLQIWRLNGNSINYIKRLGFRYNVVYKYYEYTFPVYTDKNKDTLECKLSVFLSDEDTNKVDKTIHIDVYDKNNNQYWSPFYTYNQAFESIVKSINVKILSELKRIKAKQKKTRETRKGKK